VTASGNANDAVESAAQLSHSNLDLLLEPSSLLLAGVVKAAAFALVRSSQFCASATHALLKENSGQLLDLTGDQQRERALRKLLWTEGLDVDCTPKHRQWKRHAADVQLPYPTSKADAAEIHSPRLAVATTR
jgi:hypothetical protein